MTKLDDVTTRLEASQAATVQAVSDVMTAADFWSGGTPSPLPPGGFPYAEIPAAMALFSTTVYCTLSLRMEGNFSHTTETAPLDMAVSIKS